MVRRATNPKPVSNMRRFLPSARQENAVFMRFARLDHLGRIQVIDSQCMIAVVSEGKQLVGERGFEPPTPWSRTRFRQLLNSIEFYRPQVIDVEGIAATA